MKAAIILLLAIFSNSAFAIHKENPLHFKFSHPKNNKLKIKLEGDKELSSLHSNLHFAMKLDYSERVRKNKAHLKLDAKIDHNHYFVHFEADLESNIGFDQEAEASLGLGRDFEIFHKLHLAPEVHLSHFSNMYLFDVSLMLSTTL